jgi:hypothetical protein
MLTAISIANLLLLLVACATQDHVVTEPEVVAELTPLAVGDGTYFVDLPRQNGLIFYGQQKANEVSSSGASILYPRGDVASFFVSIAMHAAIQKPVTDAKAQA